MSQEKSNSPKAGSVFSYRYFSANWWKNEIHMLFTVHFRSWAWWKSWIQVFCGCFLLAAGYVLFITPYNIVPGGVYGAGVALRQLYDGFEVGTYGLMFDIPLLIIAFRVFGRMFGTKTIFAALLTPVIMNTLTRFIGSDPETMFGGTINLSNDMIIACIFGGVIIGAGVGLVIKARATTGGTDIVAMLLTKYTGLKFSQSVVIVDSIVVVFGVIVIGEWLLPLYSLITIYVISRAIDLVVEGASYDKLLFIISDRHDELRDYIVNEMGRGGTYIKSSGIYTRKDKEMIFVVISRREISDMQNKIKEIDRNSFVVVVNAHETFGDGFKPFEEQSIA